MARLPDHARTISSPRSGTEDHAGDGAQTARYEKPLDASSQAHETHEGGPFSRESPSNRRAPAGQNECCSLPCTWLSSKIR